MKHSLEIVDRGENHRHRWLPSCTCGHRFVPLRTKVSAEESYRAHVHAAEREATRSTVAKVKRSSRQRAGRITRTGQAGPKPLTPLEQLPPELRPSPPCA